MQIYDDKQLHELVEKLNAIGSSFNEWRWTKARKQHDDEFNDIIEADQFYFKKQYGCGYDEVLKLSRASMEMLLFCLFNGNFAFERMCERWVEENKKRLREEIMAHDPLRMILGNKDFGDSNLEPSR